MRPWFDPWVGKIPWRRVWPPTPVSLPGESNGSQRVGHDRSNLACTYDYGSSRRVLLPSDPNVRVLHVDVSLETWFLPYQMCSPWILASSLRQGNNPAPLPLHIQRGDFYGLSPYQVPFDIYFNWFHFYWECITVWPGVNSLMLWLVWGLS